MDQRPDPGQQFKARFMRTSAPSSIEGIEKYLASGMIRGIGPVYARKMVKALSEAVFVPHACGMIILRLPTQNRRLRAAIPEPSPDRSSPATPETRNQ
jgi:hypothetical protein